MSRWVDAVQHRNRAELLRDLAHKSKDEDFKVALRDLAQHYENMAASFESDLKSSPAST